MNEGNAIEDVVGARDWEGEREISEILSARYVTYGDAIKPNLTQCTVCLLQQLHEHLIRIDVRPGVSGLKRFRNRFEHVILLVIVLLGRTIL